MTMHLEGPWLTSTNYSKKRKQKRKPGWQKAEAEHQAFLKKWGIDEAPKKKQPVWEPYKPTQSYRRETPRIASLGEGVGNGFKKETQTYTGTLIKGIATMHKSNAVPVINEEQAKDISSMRR